MNTKKDFITSTESLFDGRREVFTESETLLPDYYPPVLRIVGSECLPTVKSTALYGTKLVTEGTSEFRVLYQAEDGSLNAVFAKTAWSDSAELPQEAATADGIDFDVRVLSSRSDCRAVSPQKLRLRGEALLSVGVRREKKSEFLRPASGEGAEEIRICGRSVSLSVCRGVKSLRLTDELPLPEGGDKLLRYDLILKRGEHRKLDKKLIVKGEMVLRLLWWSEKDKAAFAEEKSVPLSQLTEISGMSEELAVTAGFRLGESRVEVTEGGDERTLSYDVSLTAFAEGFKDDRINLIEDAYSVSEEIEVEKKPLSVRQTLLRDEKISLREKVEIPQGCRIFDLSVRPFAPLLSCQEGQVFAQGTLSVALFGTEAGGDPFFLTRTLPYSVALGEGSPAALWGDAELTVENLAFVTDSECAEFRADCRFCGSVSGLVAEEGAVSLKKGEKKPTSPHALTVLFAEKGESLWDIAKSHSVPIGRMKKENDLEDDRLSEDKMLLL